MSKYVISYAIEEWWKIEVEADSHEDAHNKFMTGGYSHIPDATFIGSGFVQDSLDILEEIPGQQELPYDSPV